MSIYKVLFLVGIVVLVHQTPVNGMPILNLPQLPNLQSLLQQSQWKRAGFFSDDPLSTIQRSFQDMQSNVGRSMSSFLAAGSALRNRMIGMITGASKQGPSPSHHSPHPVRVLANNNIPQHSLHSHGNNIHQSSSGQTIPNLDNSIPYHDLQQVPSPSEYDSYGAPAAPLNTEYIPIKETYVDESSNFIEDSYGAPVAPLKTEYIPTQETFVIETNNDVEDSYGTPISPIHTPVEESNNDDSYGAPVKPEYIPVEDIFVTASNNDNDDSYGTPVAPVYNPSKEPVEAPVHEVHIIPPPEITADHPKGGHNPHVPNILAHNNDVGDEAVIHPGGSKDIDVHKVEILGAASVVQSPSASFPDQEHPEKYQNFDSDLLQDIVEVNLWYKDTHKLKHHKKGLKKK